MSNKDLPKKLKPISKKEIARLLQKGAKEAAINREAMKAMSVMGANVRGMVFRTGGPK